MSSTKEVRFKFSADTSGLQSAMKSMTDAMGRLSSGAASFSNALTSLSGGPLNGLSSSVTGASTALVSLRGAMSSLPALSGKANTGVAVMSRTIETVRTSSSNASTSIRGLGSSVNAISAPSRTMAVGFRNAGSGLQRMSASTSIAVKELRRLFWFETKATGAKKELADAASGAAKAEKLLSDGSKIATSAEKDQRDKSLKAAKSKDALSSSAKGASSSEKMLSSSVENAAASEKRLSSSTKRLVSSDRKLSTSANDAAASENNLSKSSDRAKNKITGLRNTTKNTEAAIRHLGLAAQRAGRALTVALTAPIVGLSTASVVLAGKLELQQAAFERFTGSATLAKGVLEDLDEFATQTPFRFDGLTRATRKLMVMGSTASQATRIVKRMSDVVAATGGTSANLEEVITAMAKMKAEGRAMFRDIFSLARNNIRIFDILKERLGLTGKEIRNIGKSAVSADDVINAVLADTAEKYDGMAKEMSLTTAGLFSSLQDAFARLGRKVGKEIIEITGLNKMMLKLRKYVSKAAKSFEGFAKAHPVVTAVAGAFFLALAALGPLVIGIGNLASAFVFISLSGELLVPILGSIAASLGVATIATEGAEVAIAGAGATAGAASAGFFSLAGSILLAVAPFAIIGAAIVATLGFLYVYRDGVKVVFGDVISLFEQAARDTARQVENLLYTLSFIAVPAGLAIALVNPFLGIPIALAGVAVLITEHLGGIKKTYEDFIANSKGIGRGISSGIAGGVLAAFPQVIAALGGVTVALKIMHADAKVKAEEAGEDVGKSFAEKLADGIKEATGSVDEALGDTSKKFNAFSSQSQKSIDELTRFMSSSFVKTGEDMQASILFMNKIARSEDISDFYRRQLSAMQGAAASIEQLSKDLGRAMKDGMKSGSEALSDLQNHMNDTKWVAKRAADTGIQHLIDLIGVGLKNKATLSAEATNALVEAVKAVKDKSSGAAKTILEAMVPALLKMGSSGGIAVEDLKKVKAILDKVKEAADEAAKAREKSSETNKAARDSSRALKDAETAEHKALVERNKSIAAGNKAMKDWLGLRAKILFDFIDAIHSIREFGGAIRGLAKEMRDLRNLSKEGKNIKAFMEGPDSVDIAKWTRFIDAVAAGNIKLAKSLEPVGRNFEAVYKQMRAIQYASTLLAGGTVEFGKGLTTAAQVEKELAKQMGTTVAAIKEQYDVTVLKDGALTKISPKIKDMADKEKNLADEARHAGGAIGDASKATKDFGNSVDEATDKAKKGNTIMRDLDSAAKKFSEDVSEGQKKSGESMKKTLKLINQSMYDALQWWRDATGGWQDANDEISDSIDALISKVSSLADESENAADKMRDFNDLASSMKDVSSVGDMSGFSMGGKSTYSSAYAQNATLPGSGYSSGNRAAVVNVYPQGNLIAASDAAKEIRNALFDLSVRNNGLGI